MTNVKRSALIATATTTLATALTGTLLAATPAAAATGTGTPVPGSGGLILRHHNGTPTSSGMWENANFVFDGTCIRIAGVDYIKVRQLDDPDVIEGYGPRHRGYVTRSAANISGLPC